jgi:selenium metabolism protein YedF
MMEQLDVRDLACPEPVIRTKKAIEANPDSVIEILLNSPASQTNVTRMARSMGAEVQVQELPGGEVRLTVTTGEAEATPEPAAQLAVRDAPAPGARATVFIKNNVMGLGDDELGRILMRAFLKTLKSAEPLPKEILFVNNGVHLTTEGSEEIPTLRELADLGVEIISCGTCLDFFHKLDQVEVGIVGNMLDIVEHLNRAAKIIAP